MIMETAFQPVEKNTALAVLFYMVYQLAVSSVPANLESSISYCS